MKNGFNYILSKQKQWATRNYIALIGSKNKKGDPHYTQELEDNLFMPLTSQIRADFLKGDGGEISNKNNFPAKMNAVHSSSALGVNIFQYWKTVGKIDNIAHACGLCSKDNKSQKDIRFEQKYVISKEFNFSPNIDVVIENTEDSLFKIFAIECKFSEAYSTRKHCGIDPKYFNGNIKSLWNDIPHIYDLAKSISPDDKVFRFFHAAQLIKHVLGLKKKLGKKSFRLLYLWYDVLGEEGYLHRKEIEMFKAFTKADDLKFSSISFQKLITFLSSNYYDKNKKYIHYITDRYL